MATTLPLLLWKVAGAETIADKNRLSDYAVDDQVPEVVVLPATVEGMCQALALSSQEGKRVVPWGGGTQMGLGNLPRGVDIVVGLSRLNRLIEHQPSDLTVTVEAGITLAQLQEHLARARQFLPVQAPAPSSATIGGILAVNTSGPSRLAYGTPRDWLIGVKVVHSDGVATKSGGKVVKNVSGYDLNKLYTGSMGTLGVIVEATLKVSPLPPVSQTLIATFASLAGASNLATRVLTGGHQPHAMVLLDRGMAERPELGPVLRRGGYSLIALFSGRTRAVERRVNEVADLATSSGAAVLSSLTAGDSDSLWQRLIDLGWTGPAQSDLGLKISVLPSQVVSLTHDLEALVLPSLQQGIMAEVGTGTVRSLWWREGTPSNLKELLLRVRGLAMQYHGYSVTERCPTELKRGLDVWHPAPPGLDIMRRLKAQLDPANLLNPGRFVGGI